MRTVRESETKLFRARPPPFLFCLQTYLKARAQTGLLNIISHLAPQPPRSARFKHHRPKERRREGENISLIYITRLFQSNMAIHQRGFQWQAITRLPGSSACRLHCCRSSWPQRPNSSWKQYLYIYYIFTQYLPFCKTISYLTINSPRVFFFPLSPLSLSFFFSPSCLALPPTPHLSLYIYPLACFYFFFWVFFSLSIPQFSLFFLLPFRRYSSSSRYLSLRLVYRWNWIFLLSHGGQSLQQLPSHSKVSPHCERKKYWGKSIKKKKKTVIASVSLSLSLTCDLHHRLGLLFSTLILLSPLPFVYLCGQRNLPVCWPSHQGASGCIKMHFCGIFLRVRIISNVKTHFCFANFMLCCHFAA